MFKRIIKGDADYINKKRTRTILITILFFTISLGLFVIGYITTGSKRNLLTVVAVLGCLPSAKSAVNMIMFIRAKGCSKEIQDRINQNVGRLVSMYDMYFTSYKKNFNIAHMIVDNKVIIGFSEDIKCDFDMCKEHISTILKQAGYKGVKMTFTADIDKYIEMLKNLNNIQNEIVEETDDINKDDEIRITLYEITL